jgi:hypothetical protein
MMNDDDHQDIGGRSSQKQPKPPRVARDDVFVDQFVDNLAWHPRLADLHANRLGSSFNGFIAPAMV